MQIDPKVNKRAKIIAAVLLVVGLAQMTGDLTGQLWLKGLASTTMCSPCPKVFTAHKGLETYATQFFIEWKGVDGKEHSLPVTPEVYARIQGPYNRRNIYGAVLAFGPVLATDPKGKPMFDSVSKYAFAGNGPLLRELGIDPETISGNVRVRYVPARESDMPGLPRLLEVQR
ncbi:MAG: hypothetical protein K2W82_15580 [Candidatus Obscuribacterales bacterium]|nr:hypothetical protein [Candidatus Obscuribacterales bacterium]